MGSAASVHRLHRCEHDGGFADASAAPAGRPHRAERQRRGVASDDFVLAPLDGLLLLRLQLHLHPPVVQLCRPRKQPTRQSYIIIIIELPYFLSLGRTGCWWFVPYFGGAAHQPSAQRAALHKRKANADAGRAAPVLHPTRGAMRRPPHALSATMKGVRDPSFP